ncbi:MAG: radical SAM protein [Proteobacteria bacterium]|nr:radical SAM protein [Pseudomonadota bacterium]
MRAAFRTLIAKTWRQLNHEMPIPLYRPLPDFSKTDAWRAWLADPDVPDELRARLGLYVHVPYCLQECSFCYLERRLVDGTVGVWLQSLIDEADALAPILEGTPFRTVYLGGGTPGALTPAQLETLLGTLADRFDLGDVAEWSLESDLPSLTAPKLEAMKRHGVTRLSVGLQNLDEDALAANKRLVGFDVNAKLALLESHRFDRLNLDVIVGIPGSNLANVEHTVRTAIQLRPTRISLYTFNPYEGYAFDFTDEAATDRFVRERAEQIELARRLVGEAGLPDHDNLQLHETMTAHAPLVGLGPSANNRLPLHCYFKNPTTQQYLRDPNAVIGRRIASIDEELECFLFNCLVRNRPADLRLARRLFGWKPSAVYAFCAERLGDAITLGDGVIGRTPGDDVAFGELLLERFDLGREQQATVTFPPELEGVPEDRLAEVMIGY